MKFPISFLLVLVVAGCSNPESGFLIEKTTVTKEERPLVDSTELAREELKDSARGLVQGKVSEEVVVANFSKLFGIGQRDEASLKSSRDYSAYTANVEIEVATLNNELSSIFNERIELFLNLLNQSLAGKNISSVKITIDQKNPKSAQNALNILYTTLRSRGKELSLREQYLVFQLTELFIDKYNSENPEEIIPRETVAKFVQDQVKFHSDKPDLTFSKYQMVARFLSAGELLNAMKPVFSKVTLGEHSSANELEVFRIISNFAIRKNIVDITRETDDVKRFYKNLYYASARLINNIPSKDSQVLAFFDSIDMAFKSNEVFLGKLASQNSLSIKEIAEIQDEFVVKFYFPYLKTLDSKKDRIKQMQEKIRVNYTSVNLENLMISFFAINSTEKQKVNFEHLKLKAEELLKDLNSIDDEIIKNYLTNYQKAVLIADVMSLTQRFSVQKPDLELYLMYESSKTALKSALRSREKDRIESLDQLINQDEKDEEIYLEAAVYRGDLKVNKKIILHPLAVIIPEKETLSIEVETLIGGRIDAGFETIDTSVVKNQSDSVSVSRGNRPHQVNELIHKTKPCMSKRCGWDPEVGPPEVTYTYQLNVVGASAPDQELAGVSGIKGKNITIQFTGSSDFMTPVFSNGQRGFKGRQALSSPLCNSANEYSPFRGADHKYSCVNEECKKVQNEISYNKIFHVSSGVSGNGGAGGSGGDITIINKSKTATSPVAISLGAPGGIPGDGALCAPPGEAARMGKNGESGPRGKVFIQQ